MTNKEARIGELAESIKKHGLLQPIVLRGSLCPEVQKLVEKRKIDLINIVHYMRNFNPEAQQVIAREIIEGRLSGEDIRVLAPFQKSYPHLTIEQLISRVQKSKNIKVYIAYFRIPPEFKNTDELKKRFEKIVGETELISFSVKDQAGILELTSVGQKKLREAAKERELSLRKFVDMIVGERGSWRVLE